MRESIKVTGDRTPKIPLTNPTLFIAPRAKDPGGSTRNENPTWGGAAPPEMLDRRLTRNQSFSDPNRSFVHTHHAFV